MSDVTYQMSADASGVLRANMQAQQANAATAGTFQKVGQQAVQAGQGVQTAAAQIAGSLQQVTRAAAAAWKPPKLNVSQWAASLRPMVTEAAAVYNEIARTLNAPIRAGGRGQRIPPAIRDALRAEQQALVQALQADPARMAAMQQQLAARLARPDARRFTNFTRRLSADLGGLPIGTDLEQIAVRQLAAQQIRGLRRASAIANAAGSGAEFEAAARAGVTVADPISLRRFRAERENARLEAEYNRYVGQSIGSLLPPDQLNALRRNGTAPTSIEDAQRIREQLDQGRNEQLARQADKFSDARLSRRQAAAMAFGAKPGDIVDGAGRAGEERDTPLDKQQRAERELGLARDRLMRAGEAARAVSLDDLDQSAQLLARTYSSSAQAERRRETRRERETRAEGLRSARRRDVIEEVGRRIYGRAGFVDRDPDEVLRRVGSVMNTLESQGINLRSRRDVRAHRALVDDVAGVPMSAGGYGGGFVGAAPGGPNGPGGGPGGFRRFLGGVGQRLRGMNETGSQIGIGLGGLAFIGQQALSSYSDYLRQSGDKAMGIEDIVAPIAGVGDNARRSAAIRGALLSRSSGSGISAELIGKAQFELESSAGELSPDLRDAILNEAVKYYQLQRADIGSTAKAINAMRQLTGNRLPGGAKGVRTISNKLAYMADVGGAEVDQLTPYLAMITGSFQGLGYGLDDALAATAVASRSGARPENFSTAIRNLPMVFTEAERKGKFRKSGDFVKDVGQIAAMAPEDLLDITGRDPYMSAVFLKENVGMLAAYRARLQATGADEDVLGNKLRGRAPDVAGVGAQLLKSFKTGQENLPTQQMEDPALLRQVLAGEARTLGGMDAASSFGRSTAMRGFHDLTELGMSEINAAKPDSVTGIAATALRMTPMYAVFRRMRSSDQDVGDRAAHGVRLMQKNLQDAVRSGDATAQPKLDQLNLLFGQQLGTTVAQYDRLGNVTRRVTNEKDLADFGEMKSTMPNLTVEGYLGYMQEKSRRTLGGTKDLNKQEAETLRMQFDRVGTIETLSGKYSGEVLDNQLRVRGMAATSDTERQQIQRRAERRMAPQAAQDKAYGDMVAFIQEQKDYFNTPFAKQQATVGQLQQYAQALGTDSYRGQAIQRVLQSAAPFMETSAGERSTWVDRAHYQTGNNRAFDAIMAKGLSQMDSAEYDAIDLDYQKEGRMRKEAFEKVKGKKGTFEYAQAFEKWQEFQEFDRAAKADGVKTPEEMRAAVEVLDLPGKAKPIENKEQLDELKKITEAVAALTTAINQQASGQGQAFAQLPTAIGQAVAQSLPKPPPPKNTWSNAGPFSQ